MAGALSNDRYVCCPNGCDLAMYDNQQTCFDGLIDFIRDMRAGRD
jgi:hypothetical protein